MVPQKGDYVLLLLIICCIIKYLAHTLSTNFVSSEILQTWFKTFNIPYI